MAWVTTFGNDNCGLQVGTVHGPVHNTIHVPPSTARPETPPQPSIVIPFARDGDFVDHGLILEDLETRCAVSDSRMALVGLGGVGKSQLAIEHAYRTHTLYPDTWVLWVYASNAARYEQSLRDIADTVKISGWQDPQTNIFKLVHDWLRDCKHRWLLVLDNVDDASFLLDQPAASTNPSKAVKPLRDYLPHCERGSIVVTTRNREAALGLVEQRDIIAVEPMDTISAIALLSKKLKLEVDTQKHDSDVAELTEKLEYMPLAIVQAAAYILRRWPRYSVTRYLGEYRKSERKRTSLLNYDEGQLRRDWEAKNSIIVTWQISFEHIRQTRRSAAELLSLMSFFDRQGIPEDVLRRRGKQNDDISNMQDAALSNADADSDDDGSQSITSVESEDNTFEDDVVMLRDFCFISDESDGTSFKMHALVQLATRTWLAANGESERWKQQFVSHLSAVFPKTGEHKNWTVCQRLFAHAKMAVGHQPEAEPSQVVWASLLYRAAWFAERIGNANDAITLATESMKARKRILGHEHEDTLWSMAIVGSAYRLGGRWENAQKLEVEVLDTRRTELGADHPDTIISMGNLALTYKSQGRFEDAEKLEVEALETRKIKLGADHPHTLTNMANLASTYRMQGRWEDAEKLEVEVVETHKTKFEADYLHTLPSIANLASTYWNQGRWQDAEKLEVEVVETSKTKLGVDHPITLTSVANLASTYWHQGRWEDAEKLFKEVLELRKAKLGANHPDTLISTANLASTYWYQGRWEEAEKLEVETLEASKATLGEDHPITLTSMSNLASTYGDQGRWEDAEKLDVGVLEIRKTKLGADHPSTLTSMHNLAFIWRSLGKHAEAVALMEECVQLRQQTLGDNHPNLMSALRVLVQWRAEQTE